MDIRKPGAQPGNTNAVKEITAKRVTIRLYEADRDLLEAIAVEVGVSRNEAARQAIREMGKRLGVK